MNKHFIPAGEDRCAQVDVTGLGAEPGGLGDVCGIAGAIATARDWGGITYLMEDGRPVAAIVGVLR